MIRAAFLACLVMVLGWSEAAAELEVIEQKRCDLPPALRGVTGHMLMRYYVSDQGRVNFVESAFSRIQPADKLSAVEQHLKDCLLGWRYRPLGKEQMAKSHLELLIAFHYFSPVPAGGPGWKLPNGRMVPRAHLEEMRTLKLELAEQLMKGPDYREESGEGWILRSNVRKADRAPCLAAIEAAKSRFDAVFPGAPPDAGGSPIIVLLFGKQDQFNRISAFDNLYPKPPLGGQYVPDEGTAYTFAAAREAPLELSQDYLRHEVTHHLVWRRLSGGKRDAPGWVDEGIATFVELLLPEKKGKVNRVRFQRGQQADGEFRWMSPSEDYLNAVEIGLRDRSLPDLETFLRGESDLMRVDLAYGLSWVLVHYLINAEGGALYAPFTAWMLGPMGTPEDPGLLQAIGRTPDQLLPALREHVRQMRQRG